MGVPTMQAMRLLRLSSALKTTAMTVVLLAQATCALADPRCAALDREVKKSETVIQSCKAVHEVVGTGRLQFFSAPDAGCKMPGVFVIPGQTVIAYSEYKDYTSVMYINQKTNDTVEGWVLSARLKATGTGIAPCQ